MGYLIILVIILFGGTSFLFAKAAYHTNIAKDDNTAEKAYTVRWWAFSVLAGVATILVTIFGATPLWGAITAAVVEVLAWVVLVSLSSMKQYR